MFVLVFDKTKWSLRLVSRLASVFTCIFPWEPICVFANSLFVVHSFFLFFAFPVLVWIFSPFISVQLRAHASVDTYDRPSRRKRHAAAVIAHRHCEVSLRSTPAQRRTHVRAKWLLRWSSALPAMCPVCSPH